MANTFDDDNDYDEFLDESGSAFDYQNLTQQGIDKTLLGTDTDDKFFRRAIHERHAFEIEDDSLFDDESDELPDYFIWNDRQDKFFKATHVGNVRHTVEKSSAAQLRDAIREDVEKRYENDIASLTHQKRELTGWDKFVNFFSFLGFSTETLDHNKRIDKAVEAKVNAAVRDRMSNAGITNEKVLPKADKELAGKSWNELKDYVQNGKAAFAKEGEVTGKTGNTDIAKENRERMERGLAKKLLQDNCADTPGAEKLIWLIDHDYESSRDMVKIFSNIQTCLDTEKGSTTTQDADIARRLVSGIVARVPRNDKEVPDFARNIKNDIQMRVGVMEKFIPKEEQEEINYGMHKF